MLAALRRVLLAASTRSPRFRRRGVRQLGCHLPARTVALLGAAGTRRRPRKTQNSSGAPTSNNRRGRAVFRAISEPAVSTRQAVQRRGRLCETPDQPRHPHIWSGHHTGPDCLGCRSRACWLSHLLNRYGCRTVSVDVSQTALALGRRLFTESPQTNWTPDPIHLRLQTYRDAPLNSAGTRGAEHMVPACRPPTLRRRSYRSPSCCPSYRSPSCWLWFRLLPCCRSSR